MSDKMSLEALRELRNSGIMTSLDRVRKLSEKSRRSKSVINHSSNISSERNGKFNAKKVTINGVKFDSKAESERYVFLREQQRKGVIYDLVLQKKFDIVINDTYVCSYISDFCYKKKGIDILIIEDVKGVKTPVYSLKKKLMVSVLGIEIVEVRKENLSLI